MTHTVEPEPTYADATELPAPEDFEISVRVTEKQCFGSAGCNVSFTIDPTYVGSANSRTLLGDLRDSWWGGWSDNQYL